MCVTKTNVVVDNDDFDDDDDVEDIDEDDNDGITEEQRKKMRTRYMKNEATIGTMIERKI